MLDLRAEPWVLSVPAVPGDRYVTFQWFDLFTYNFAYVGVLSTGREAGSYLFAGPSWDGDIPPGIDKVFRSETDFIRCLGRTSVDDADNLPNLRALQQQYRLASLSGFVRDDPVIPDSDTDLPAWDEKRALSADFIAYLNSLLQFTLPTDPSETDLMARFSRVGIGPGLPFAVDNLDPDVLGGIEAGLRAGEARLKDAIAHAFTSVGMFGSRKTLGTQYLKRAVAAAAGIYGNNAEEAIYIGWHIDADQQPLSGAHRYEVTFGPGRLPPVKLCWSIRMYALPSRLLVDNPIDRYFDR